MRLKKKMRGTSKSYSGRMGDSGINSRKMTGGCSSRRRMSNDGGRLRRSSRGGSRGTIGGDSSSRMTMMTSNTMRSISKRMRRSS